MNPLSQYSLPVYRHITRIGAPLVTLYLKYRLSKGKEDPVRFGERFGQASKPRQDGTLIWFHAASVGEATSLLKLIEHVTSLSPNTQLLLTSGTVTSAKLLASILPAHVIHQFTPVDTPQAVGAFLDHWKPDIAVFTESELWPNILLESHARGVKLALVNARMSEKSFNYWQHQPEMITAMLGCFSFVTAQTSVDVSRYKTLGAANVLELGNLKYDAEPLDCDEDLLKRIRTQIAGRPCIVAASLHPGEDELLVSTHATLEKTFPNLLTIIIPRHPERGSGMTESAKALTSNVGRRSQGDLPDAQTQIYIADSIGEMGLWYQLADIVIMGGSFIAHGGQNPLEPIRLHRPVIAGPHMFNFAEIVAQLLNIHALVQVENADALASHCTQLLNDANAREALVQSADAWLAATPPIAKVIAEKLHQLLEAS